MKQRYDLTNILATDLTNAELQDVKVLCLLQDKTIRKWASELVRRELRIRAETIAMAKNALPSKGETLKECLDRHFPPRGRGGHKPKVSKLLDMTMLGMDEEG